MEFELDVKVKPGMEVGGYRIERKLGAGGFGGVYLARRDGRPCALKFIHLLTVGDWGWRELFVMLPQQSDHVVRLRGHLQWPEDSPDYLVLVMDYVPGPTLYEWAREHNPCAREVVEKLLPLARALRVLHARGVFHRDLKGDNVLVRESDGEPVLVDFGAGWSPLVPRVTKGALPPASLYYRSPESLVFNQNQGHVSGTRYPYAQTDEVYSLGVMLYVLLTDVYPFTGPDAELVEDILDGNPKPPHERNARVPEAISRLCLKMLAREPRERVPDAGALCEALTSVLRDSQGAPDWERPLCFDRREVERTTEDIPPEGGVIDPRVWMAGWKDKKPRRGPRPGAARARWLGRWLGHLWPRLVLVALAVGVTALLCLWMGGESLERSSSRLTAWMTQSAKGLVVGRPGDAPPLVPNQKRAPCTIGLEREVSGGCWLATEHQPPKCPPQTVAYEGRCLLPVAKSSAVPVSVDAGGPAPSP